MRKKLLYGNIKKETDLNNNISFSIFDTRPCYTTPAVDDEVKDIGDPVFNVPGAPGIVVVYVTSEEPATVFLNILS